MRLDHLLRRAGADSTLRIWEGMWHVFEFYPDIPEADALADGDRRFSEPAICRGIKKDPPEWRVFFVLRCSSVHDGIIRAGPL